MGGQEIIVRHSLVEKGNVTIAGKQLPGGWYRHGTQRRPDTLEISARHRICKC